MASKLVTMKTYHNLVTSKSPASDALKVLATSYGGTDATVKILKNEKNELKAIFYQDKEMQRIFSLCPEVLFVDAIYKVNDLRMPLRFLVVDSNGLSEIVGFCLLTSEDKENVTDMALTFKKHNPQWEHIKCIMADKDFTERNVFKQQFPDSQILICIFHCLRSMSHEITCEKMKINYEERLMCLEIIQDIVYAKNATHYDEIHKKLESTNINTVIDYFNKNWHGIITEWVIYFQSKFMTLGFLNDNETDRSEELELNEPQKSVLNELPTLPPRIPKRGRPKSNDKTAIGIPKKRKMAPVGLVSFRKLPMKMKQCQMLNVEMASRRKFVNACNGFKDLNQCKLCRIET
ncbi:uncharacterized protein LOC111027507 [Myzus persicae]|uniref:uncharacterized protein LOC111027507 n=1 Tax=Myzus persicae TaxID=13164 RepID=UPI000B930C3E|nr:uncharacterized protein LOC111027507 [Myzus persicae]